MTLEQHRVLKSAALDRDLHRLPRPITWGTTPTDASGHGRRDAVDDRRAARRAHRARADHDLQAEGLALHRARLRRRSRACSSGRSHSFYESSLRARPTGLPGRFLRHRHAGGRADASAVLVAMLALYAFRVIRVTEKLRAGIIAATGAVAAGLPRRQLRHADSSVRRCPYLHEQRPDRHRHQPGHRRHRGVQPAAGLRPDRERRPAGRAEVHGVVRRASRCWSRWSGCTSRSCGS